MLNLRLLYSVLGQRPLRAYLGILCGFGFAILLDIVLILKLAFLIGPWMTMAVLAILTSIDIFVIYKLVELRNVQLIESIHRGEFNEKRFTNYVSALLAGLFFIPPGFANTIIGILLLVPPISVFIGSIPAKVAGINWVEAYEYLRFDSFAGSSGKNIIP